MTTSTKMCGTSRIASCTDEIQSYREGLRNQKSNDEVGGASNAPYFVGWSWRSWWALTIDDSYKNLETDGDGNDNEDEDDGDIVPLQVQKEKKERRSMLDWHTPSSLTKQI